MNDDLARTMRWHNGEKAWSPFSPAEMDGRQAAMRAVMARRDIDAALFTSYHNICYLTGFLYCQFGRRYGLVLDQRQATTIAAAIDGGQPWRRSHGDALTYTDWQRDNYFHAVRQLTPGVRRLGIEFDHVTLETLAMLEAALPGVELVDIANEAMRLRTIIEDLFRRGEEVRPPLEGEGERVGALQRAERRQDRVVARQLQPFLEQVRPRRLRRRHRRAAAAGLHETHRQPDEERHRQQRAGGRRRRRAAVPGRSAIGEEERVGGVHQGQDQQDGNHQTADQAGDEARAPLRPSHAPESHGAATYGRACRARGRRGRRRRSRSAAAR